MTDSNVTNGVNPEFGVGTVLSQTFSTFFANFFKFFVIGVLGYVVIYGIMGLLSGGALLPGADPSQIAEMPAMSVLSYVVSMVGAAVIQASVTYGAVEHQAGHKASISGMIGIGLKKIVPVVLASLIVSILTVIGFLFLIIPGIIIMLMFVVTVPVIVAEGKGPMDAIHRSRELTSGYKWQILAVYVVLIIMAWIIMGVLGGALGAMMIAAFSDGGVATTATIMALVVASLFGGVSYGFMGSVVASVYTNLRAVKEGTSVEEIAKVFA